MTFHIITIFPETFDSYLNESIVGRAIRNKKISIKFYNPRDFVPGPKKSYRPTDDRPYGGGPGMVMEAMPILKATEAALRKIKDYELKIKGKRQKAKVKIIIFSPSGKKFTNDYARKTVKNYADIILICGRYEGIDARVKKILKAEEISVGDYVLTGGELPAMILVDAMSRQIGGVLHKSESLEENRITSSEVYTRPEALKYKGKTYKVPKILLSGDHKKIEEWKKNRRKSE
jgi:tRNA (guanine37-N1)-methyltransferase